MKCKSINNFWYEGWKMCEKCGCSWPKSYGEAPICSYKEPEKCINGHLNKPDCEYCEEERQESNREFNKDIKLDKLLVI